MERVKLSERFQKQQIKAGLGIESILEAIVAQKWHGKKLLLDLELKILFQ